MPIERPSDREYPCFFCFEGKSKDKNAHCSACKRPINLGPLLVGRTVDTYVLKAHVSRGYYGVTFKAENRIGKPFALKLVPKRLYDRHDKSFEDEIARYRRLGSHPHIADLIDAGSVELSLDDTLIEFFFILMEWIEGITLTQYLTVSAVFRPRA